MEFVEAPVFTRRVSYYLADEDYRELQRQLAANPQMGDLMPGREGFESFAGATPGAAKAGGAACGLSITTSRQTGRSG